MSTQATETPATNSDGELLTDAEIHYIANSSRVAITISSVVSKPFADGVNFYKEAHRELLTISTEPTGGLDSYVYAYASDLEEAISNWRLTPKIERLMRAAVTEGLHIVNTVD